MGVAGFGSLGDEGENARKNFVGSGAGAIAKFGPAREFEMSEDFRANGGVGPSAIAFAHRGSNGEAPHIEGAALVAEQWSVTSGAGCVTLRITAKGRGSGAGHENDRGPLADRIER